MADVIRQVGARLTQPVNQLLQQRFYPGPMESLRRSYEAFHAFDKAHTVALAEVGLMPPEAARAILKGLRVLESEGVQKVRDGMGGGRHSGEAYLTSRIDPDDAGWINLGRSSGDMDAVAWRFVLRARLPEVFRQLLSIRRALIDLAGMHLETVMPSYTCLQHAQTTTLAHMLLSWEAPFRRDTTRYFSAYDAAGGSPAGSGILTGSTFAVPRRRTAELLGFDRIELNTRDAVLNLDVVLEAHSDVSICIANLVRMACDLHMWTTTEFAMVELADEYCSTSSIMPQKKNPWTLAWIKGQGSLALGRLAGVFAVVRAESDQLESTLLVPWELWEALDDARDMLGLMAGVISTMKVRPDRMLELASQNWCQATDLAAAMVERKGMPWRASHQLTAAIVREAVSRSMKPADLTPEFIDQVARNTGHTPPGLDPSELRLALDPVEAVRNRAAVEGTPAPERVSDQLDRARASIAEDSARLDMLCERAAAARARLEEAVDAILEGGA